VVVVVVVVVVVSKGDPKAPDKFSGKNKINFREKTKSIFGEKQNQFSGKNKINFRPWEGWFRF
jgi:hypothetical protein